MLAAVFFGVLAFVLTFHQIKLERNRALGMTRNVRLIRATKDLAADLVIKQTDIEPYTTKRFRTNLSKEITWDKRNAIIGRKLAFSVDKGQTIEWYDLKMASRRKSGLSGIVQEGYRAISVAVDSTSSVTGLIQPGDIVDIIGTFRFPEMKGDKSFDTLTLTVLQKVEVLATGTDMGKTLSSAPQANSRGRKGYSSLTLSLTPKEVEMIVFASQKGRLTFSLRNDEETKIEKKLQSVNFKYLEDNIQKYNEDREKSMRLRGKSYIKSN
jgi:pilus assembly protein CpaB